MVLHLDLAHASPYVLGSKIVLPYILASCAICLQSCNSAPSAPHMPYPSVQELWDIGLRPENAFGCIASYLFRPNRDTLWLVPKPTLAIMTNPRIIKIGIQIRCGDTNIRKQQYRSADGNAEMPDRDFDRIAKPYFDCAQALERDIGVAMGEDVQVRWYLMTDTIPLRHTALRRYRDKLVTFNVSAAGGTGVAKDRLMLSSVLMAQASRVSAIWRALSCPCHKALSVQRCVFLVACQLCMMRKVNMQCEGSGPQKWGCKCIVNAVNVQWDTSRVKHCQPLQPEYAPT